MSNRKEKENKRMESKANQVMAAKIMTANAEDTDEDFGFRCVRVQCTFRPDFEKVTSTKDCKPLPDDLLQEIINKFDKLCERAGISVSVPLRASDLTVLSQEIQAGTIYSDCVVYGTSYQEEFQKKVDNLSDAIHQILKVIYGYDNLIREMKTFRLFTIGELCLARIGRFERDDAPVCNLIDVLVSSVNESLREQVLEGLVEVDDDYDNDKYGLSLFVDILVPDDMENPAVQDLFADLRMDVSDSLAYATHKLLRYIKHSPNHFQNIQLVSKVFVAGHNEDDDNYYI